MCQESMGIMLDATATIIRICSYFERWWNANIKERIMVVRREKRGRQTSVPATSPKTEIQELIEQSKTKIWSTYFTNLTGVTLWKAAQYANPLAEMSVEPLTDREGN